MRITLIPLTFLLIVIFLGSCNSTFAKENEIGQSRIHPAHPLYFLKTIRENLENSFALTDRVKLIRQLEFSTRRLREVKALVSINRQDLIAPTLERYWFHIAHLDLNLKDEEVMLKIRQSLVVHLQTLEVIYGSLSNPEAKRVVRSVIYKTLSIPALPIFAQASVCNFLAKEASSSALNQSEQIILKMRAEKVCNN